MTSIGDSLRGQRLRRGLSLEQIAAETKIGVRLLKAMEDNHFDRLPGGLLARSFVRQYANVLGLDQEEVVTSLPQLTEDVSYPLAPPQVESKSSRIAQPSALVWSALALCACGGMYRIWQHVNLPFAPTTAMVFAPPASHAVKYAAPDLRASSTPVEPPKSAANPVTASDSGRLRLLPYLESALENHTLPLSGPTGSVRVALTATEPVWLSIKSDGVLTYTGTLDQQSREFLASSIMTVVVGNAGGLRVSLNGRRVSPIGDHGNVQLLVLKPNGAYIVRRPPTLTSADNQ
jgi:cytoskeletal protein RodZ